MQINELSIRELTHTNAKEIYEKSQASLFQHKNLHLELNSIQKFDSSIFALILGLRRIANQHEFTLNISFSPKLETLSSVYGISNIL